MSDRLLYTISTRGKMNLMHYDSAFDAIYPQVYSKWPQDANITFLRRQTLRFLDSLGHCDFAYEYREVYACPPMLVLLPAYGLPKAVLTGARTQELIERLRTYAKSHKDIAYHHVVAQKTLNFLIPGAIYLEAINKDVLKDAAQSANINVQLDEPAAWYLLNFSSGIKEALQQLTYVQRADVNWPKRIFSTNNLNFSRYADDENEPRLVEYTNRVNQQRIHWIWQNNTVAEADRDWGRYIVLFEKTKNILLYDKKRNLLAVPAMVPLPRLLSRALTLCCGLVPVEVMLRGHPVAQLPANCRMHIYKAVPAPIAVYLAEKLGQELIEYELETDEEGVIP